MTEILSLVGAFIATAAWMMRTAMRNQNEIADRFIRHLEGAVQDQQRQNRLFRTVLRELTGAVRKNTKAVLQLLEKEEPNESQCNTRCNQTKVQDSGERLRHGD
ncbi:MAG: hypothetical protein D6724_05085 [Armatimonadetes bacterium]|nr:MAG: hypothetical protein D6724_05085 [Armatimonadota bacterium]GIV02703.1 MAG: hypothetical protein KatS3mg015_1533 [Fimbriimonadales bacterium]